jgi:hypothetical protein
VKPIGQHATPFIRSLAGGGATGNSGRPMAWRPLGGVRNQVTIDSTDTVWIAPSSAS